VTIQAGSDGERGRDTGNETGAIMTRNLQWLKERGKDEKRVIAGLSVELY
jgi:hypothetical protein